MSLHNYTIALIGEPGTGKTSFVERHTYGCYADNYAPSSVVTSELSSSFTQCYLNPKGKVFNLKFNMEEFETGMIPLGGYGRYDAIFLFVSPVKKFDRLLAIKEIQRSKTLDTKPYVTIIKNYSEKCTAFFGTPLNSDDAEVLRTIKAKTSGFWKRPKKPLEYGQGWCIAIQDDDIINAITKAFSDFSISYFVFERKKGKLIPCDSGSTGNFQPAEIADTAWKKKALSIQKFCANFAPEVPVYLVVNKIDLHRVDLKNYLKNAESGSFDLSNTCAISVKTGYKLEVPLLLFAKNVIGDRDLVHVANVGYGSWCEITTEEVVSLVSNEEISPDVDDVETDLDESSDGSEYEGLFEYQSDEDDRPILPSAASPKVVAPSPKIASPSLTEKSKVRASPSVDLSLLGKKYRTF